jgi:hypothetical protein
LDQAPPYGRKRPDNNMPRPGRVGNRRAKKRLRSRLAQRQTPGSVSGRPNTPRIN